MPHEIDYSATTTTPAEKRKRALDDIADWFGKRETMPNLMDEIRGLPHTYETARSIRWQLAMFAGIQGYPVVALLAECWEESDDEILLLFELNDKPDEELS